MVDGVPLEDGAAHARIFGPRRKVPWIPSVSSSGEKWLVRRCVYAWRCDSMEKPARSLETTGTWSVIPPDRRLQ